MMKQKIGLPIPVSKYKWWDKTMPLFTKGEYPDGKKASVQGGAPIKFQYYADKDGTKLSPTPTEYLTSIPTLTNADTLGIRPDLVGRKIDSWAELINPQFKGKAALVDAAGHRHPRRRHGARGLGRDEIRRQGQPDQGGDRQDHHRC